MQKPLIVAGIPGCGKSTFGRWLKQTYGFVHVEMEHDGLDVYRLRKDWEAYIAGSDQKSFPAALARVASPVVLDWGFPPSLLDVVIRMKSDRFRMCWFDGDRLTARKLFEERRTVPVSQFDAQFAAISTHWSEIAPVFAGHIVRVVLPDGSRLADEAIHNLIIGSNVSEGGPL